jgi:hypothetical protein
MMLDIPVFRVGDLLECDVPGPRKFIVEHITRYGEPVCRNDSGRLPITCNLVHPEAMAVLVSVRRNGSVIWSRTAVEAEA